MLSNRLPAPGRYTKDGKYIPKHVKLTPISRLRWYKWYEPEIQRSPSDWRTPRIKMVGYPKYEMEIYRMHMEEKSNLDY